METVKHLGVENDNLGLDFFLTEKDKIEDLPNEFIAFAIGGKHETKKLPEEKSLAFAEN